MTTRPGTRLRRRILYLVAGLWAVLVAIWLLRTSPSGDAVDWLTFAVAILPVLLVYELWGLFAEAVRRRRRAREKPDA